MGTILSCEENKGWEIELLVSDEREVFRKRSWIQERERRRE